MFTYFYALYMSTFFYPHITRHFYILLRSYNYSSLHTSTPISAEDRFTYFYADIRPIYIYIYIPPYFYTYLNISMIIFFYMIIYFYANIRAIHAYIILRPYVPYKCLHISMDIYALYMSTYFYARNRNMFTYFHTLITIHVYILIRTLMLYKCLYTSTSTSDT